MSELDRITKERLGVDGKEQVAKYLHIIERGIHNDHIKEIQAAATAGAVSFNLGDAESWWGAALTIFAIGYTAGVDQPDLSVFQAVLNEEETE